MTDSLAQGLASYLEEKVTGASDVRVDEVERIYGGASRETYALRASYRTPEGHVEKALILRRDPPSGIIETDRATEFEAYRAFHGTSVPVPEPLFLEAANNPWLERPFFIMERIEGCESDLRLFVEPPYLQLVDQIGEQKWRILGQIAHTDPHACGLDRTMESPPLSGCWKRELDYWEGVIDSDEITPQPIARAAIRHLRSSPPPSPSKLAVVHGDYRSGNFLFDEKGTIRAILDWEMCHLGDPLEDLAWAFNPLWSWSDPGRPGKLIPREKALSIWEETSGIEANPEALRWWETFSSIKGLAIWISSAREFSDGKNIETVLVFPSWYCLDVHNRVLLERIAPDGSDR